MPIFRDPDAFVEAVSPLARMITKRTVEACDYCPAHVPRTRCRKRMVIKGASYRCCRSPARAVKPLFPTLSAPRNGSPRAGQKRDIACYPLHLPLVSAVTSKLIFGGGVRGFRRQVGLRIAGLRLVVRGMFPELGGSKDASAF